MFAFCVITFEPIKIQTCSAPQNDRLIFSFVKDIKVGVEKMTPSWSKNGLLSAASFVFRNHRAEFATDKSPFYDRFYVAGLLPTTFISFTKLRFRKSF